MTPGFVHDPVGPGPRGERVAAIDAVGTVAALLERAAETMDRSGRWDVAASHRQVARALREDA